MPDPPIGALPLDPNDPRIKAMGLGIRAPQLLGPLADLAKPQPPPEANKNIFAVNPVSAAAPTPAPKPLSQQYAELQGQEPQRSDPQYKVPGWKQALGLTFATLGGIGNPGRASELAEGVLHGPYNRAEQDWRNKGLAIEQQSKIGDTESQMRERERKANEPYRPESIGNEEAQAVEEQVAKGTPRVDAIGNVKSAGQKVPEAEQPLGDKTTNLNKALESRYQVLNPGKPLPPELSLDSKATQKDFDRVDKIMQQTEVAKGTAAQQATANEIRRQTAAIAQQSFALRQDEAAARKSDKANKVGDKFDEASATAASKDTETARGGDFRFRSMAGSLPNAQKGDQQAMMNLLTNHIGMTLGMQKGARITRDILQEAQKSTPWLQGLQAKFDDRGYLSGLVLTPQQMEQMMTLATQQRANGWAQAVESARQAGVADKLKIPSDVRIRVIGPNGKPGTIPASQLSTAEDQGYTVAPQ